MLLIRQSQSDTYLSPIFRYFFLSLILSEYRNFYRKFPPLDTSDYRRAVVVLYRVTFTAQVHPCHCFTVRYYCLSVWQGSTTACSSLPVSYYSPGRPMCNVQLLQYRILLTVPILHSFTFISSGAPLLHYIHCNVLYSLLVYPCIIGSHCLQYIHC